MAVGTGHVDLSLEGVVLNFNASIDALFRSKATALGLVHGAAATVGPRSLGLLVLLAHDLAKLVLSKVLKLMSHCSLIVSHGEEEERKQSRNVLICL